MRFSKFQVSFQQPQLFTVVGGLNVFDVVGEPLVLPLSTDPRLCRCSGYFRELNGEPKRFLSIRFTAEFDTVILDEAAVVANEKYVRTDDKGYVQIDLIRGAKYTAKIEDMGAYQLRCIAVPDTGSTNLPDLLFPIVEQITLDPEGPYSIAVASEITVTPTVLDSTGRPLTGTALQDVTWKVTDPTIALVTPATSTTLVIRGLAAGTTQLTVERLNTSIIKIPATPILGQPVDITVV
jgi:hypothetical protein